MNDRVLQQIPIPEIERQEIKALASSRGMKIYEVTDEVLEWYFRRASNKNTRIFASPRDEERNKYWSLWILEEHMREIEAKAAVEKCSSNRVIYSAFKNYLNSRKG
jgi:choline kinase